MDNGIKLGWGRKLTGDLMKRWPKAEDGTPVEPCFLTHTKGTDLDAEMTVNMLEAYGIPCVIQYPNDGDFGRVVIGISGTGVDIYVPITMYEDAISLTEGSVNFDEIF